MWVKRSVSLSPGADVKTPGHMQASVRASDKFWEPQATWRQFAPQEIQSHQLHHSIGRPFPRLQCSLLSHESLHHKTSRRSHYMPSTSRKCYAQLPVRAGFLGCAQSLYHLVSGALGAGAGGLAAQPSLQGPSMSSPEQRVLGFRMGSLSGGKVTLALSWKGNNC